MAKKTAHIISHTHWDREWYLPYEKHHARLITLMDTLLDTLAKDSSFRSFHLDGQTIIIDDYLQVRPDKREELEKYIREGRIVIGPWYILQDEFLTSSEANVRNLQIGHSDAKPYKQISKLGYFPDSFGNMGQAPQLLKQAGIDAAVFGRGVKPTGFDNAVIDSEAYESPFSELIWRSPDGTEVTGVLFANWYSNGNEIPAEPEAAKAFWTHQLREAERYASTNQLLFMNGCDHQPVQTNLSSALETARELFPDYEFKHSSFEEYLEALEMEKRDDLKVIEGELRSQHTDGWGTLVNTASARVYLKQANTKGQVLLEKGAEPAAVFAAQQNLAYPHHLLGYAWKTLMQNHPHDSICGCSVDEVHSEMMTRFAKSHDVAETLLDQSLQHIASQIDRTPWQQEGSIAFTVFNHAGVVRSGATSVILELHRTALRGFKPAEVHDRLAALELPTAQIQDDNGHVIPAVIEDLGVDFNYTLPEDRFRQPYMSRRVRVTIAAQELEGHSYQAFAYVPLTPNNQAKQLNSSSIATANQSKSNELENEFFHIAIKPNGSLTVTDKQTSEVYSDLAVFDNVGDIGNEYVFKQDGSNEVLSTRDLQAEIRLVSRSAVEETIEIVHRWEIPAEADDTFALEQKRMIPIKQRNAKRSEKQAPLVLRTQVTLEKGAKIIKLKTHFQNIAKDHRLRMLFASDTATSVHYADSIFELAKRNNKPAVEWQNPSNAQHQQAFVSVDDTVRGLAIANIGLNEYELLQDGRNTVAVTLLRAVGELGDWGVFPTPEAQCLGEHEVELAIIPYGGSAKRSEAANQAYAYQIPWYAVQCDSYQEDQQLQGKLPTAKSWISWSGEHLALSSIKRSADYNDTLVRWYNMSETPALLTLDSSSLSTEEELASGKAHWFISNILEERVTPLIPESDGFIRITIKPCEIITIGKKN